MLIVFFLHGDWLEVVYIVSLEGYYSMFSDNVCEFKKSLYSLKQTPRKWNEKLKSVLTEFNFVQIFA